MYTRILYIISILRENIPNSTKIYSNGKCYEFYLILKSIFPDAIAYYDGNHIITKIWEKYYDINGEVNDIDNYLELSKHYTENLDFRTWATSLEKIG